MFLNPRNAIFLMTLISICSLRIKRFSDTNSQILLTKRYLTSLGHLNRKFCFTHSLEQIITRPSRVTDQTATLIGHILTNSPDKVIQSGVIDLGLSDHDLIYCT